MNKVLKLQLYNQYNRKDVHDIFDPFSPYTTGSGTWGIHGIVKIPNRERDYVFFVTFGQANLGHAFEEEVTEEGVLTWQSQPKQKLSDSIIRNLINHDYLKNNIYLFLRTRRINPSTKKSEPFTYMGKLAYIIHDTEREAPVYFKWQILDWDIPPFEVLERMNLQLTEVQHGAKENRGRLYKTEKPSRKLEEVEKGVPTNQFRARHFDFAENNGRNKKIGLEGEILVLEHIKSRLTDSGRGDLASKVIHTSVVEGDGAGYDIQAFTPSGDIQFIEVKTTTGGARTPFILTSNEIAFSEEHPESYVLYRVYEFDIKTNSGKFFKIDGDVRERVELKPTQYKALL
ncbi:DUF3427 domain-containing protein [Neobacillus drentensis]|uniref:DUF3427 domain-containing protein n=1 Tax=Neobacillus drentensis TaxID=220684 RepID=UPI0030035C5F